MNEAQKYKLALKRVKQKKLFYRHLSVYLVMGAFFFLVNYFSDPNSWWFYWPMLGWGIGLALQYVKVFGITSAGLGTPEWEERQMEKEMDRLGIVSAEEPPTPLLETKPSKKEAKLDLDEHLQLKEMKVETAGKYSNDDLV